MAASVSPSRMDFTASPMACALVAQADTGDQLGPLAPKRMLTWPGAILIIICRMKNGEMRSKPFSSARLCCSSKLPMPPMPEPMMTATFSGSYPCGLSVPMGRPLSRIAISLAATAYWVNRSMRRDSRRSIPQASGSKSFTSPAMRADSWLASKRVTGPTADLPVSRPDQVFSVPVPRAVMRPVPVMTMRRGATNGRPYFLWELM